MLTIEDITEKEWQTLDFQLEKYDRIKQPYPVEEIPLLKFILCEIGIDINNYQKVPSFIRMSKEFKKCALNYNHKIYEYMR